MQRLATERIGYIALVLVREVAHHNRKDERQISQATIEIYTAMKPYLMNN